MRFRTSYGSPDPGRRSSRWRRIVLAATALVLALGVLTARLFVWPTQGMPAHVSAIVMLAGPGNRMPVALQLAREHRAPVLVVSQGQHGYGGPCPSATPGVKLICFEPDPGDTRGEAEFLGRLAKKNRWDSVVMVTSRAQDTRARIVVGRCFGGSIYVMTGSLPLGSWPHQIAYEWGALFKALVLYRSC
ncbi:MAG: YdcF family protein [Streptosporangiaceae bacterium]